MGEVVGARGDVAYSLKEVSAVLGISESRVRGLVRTGFVEPSRGTADESGFGFQDLVFLRHLNELNEARIPPRRVRRALMRLREELPQGRSLSALRLGASGHEVIVRDGELVWNAESGQYLLDCDARADVATVAPLLGPASELSADECVELGCELEARQPEQAREAYERALREDPFHADAHVNLACLDHAAGKLAEAEAHCRAALASRPEYALAAFDLGVVLEDQDRAAEARDAYAGALEADPEFADAHYNLARVHDRLGDRQAVLRHLRAYRRLTKA